ncbi:unnamed protein product [marine sediment metagenome]|uniref:Uncharacterized protein n=1 Tax=marine sediment metagenome TaxID=412755 RepID=X0TNU2_9ZZZZ
MKILKKIAGWWKIKDIESGQTDWNQPDKQEGIINSIPGEDTPKELYNGDGPADIMDEAINKITKEYQKAWNRDPEPEEIKAVFNFCFNGWKRR